MIQCRSRLARILLTLPCVLLILCWLKVMLAHSVLPFQKLTKEQENLLMSASDCAWKITVPTSCGKNTTRHASITMAHAQELLVLTFTRISTHHYQGATGLLRMPIVKESIAQKKLPWLLLLRRSSLIQTILTLNSLVMHFANNILSAPISSWEKQDRLLLGGATSLKTVARSLEAHFGILSPDQDIRNKALCLQIARIMICTMHSLRLFPCAMVILLSLHAKITNSTGF